MGGMSKEHAVLECSCCRQLVYAAPVVFIDVWMCCAVVEDYGSRHGHSRELNSEVESEILDFSTQSNLLDIPVIRLSGTDAGRDQRPCRAPRRRHGVPRPPGPAPARR